MKNKTVLNFLLLAFICFAFNASAQFEKDKARSRILQIDQIDLHATLGFVPNEGRVDGEVELKFKAIAKNLDSLWIDGIKMEFDHVFIDEQIVKYKVYPKGLAIFPESPLVVDSVYLLQYKFEAEPKRGMYFLGWNDPSGESRKQIWTQGQGIDNRHWLPHVDAQNDKLLTALSFKFQKDYKVISNGQLINKKEEDNFINWDYRMTKAHSSYLMMIAIGEYNSYNEVSNSGIEITNYYYPNWEYRNKWTYYKSKEIFDFLENEIGVPYPWQNYKQVPVKDFQHGAMENTTATIFGDFYCVDEISFNDDNYVGVNAHELAHQWFGNSVTALSSHDHWLHEGFATYYSWLVEREVFGEDRYQELLMDAEKQIVIDNMQNDFPLHHSKAGSIRFYQYGAWVLHMLNTKIGEENFKSAIKLYLEKYAYQTVTTRNFKHACEEASGQDLTQFFKQWLERQHMPIINVTADYYLKESKFTMRLEQSQEVNSHSPEYNVKIPFIIYTDADKYTYETTLGNIAKSLSLTLNPKEEVKYIEVDPTASVLAKWIFYIPNEWIFNQLNEGESKTFANRILKTADEEGYTENVFKEIDIKTWPAHLQVEWINHVIDNSNFSEKYVASQVETASLSAKKAYLNGKQIPKSHEKMVRSWLKAPSYELIETALLKLFLSFRDNGDDYLKLTEGVNGTRGNNVRVMWEFVSYINSKGKASTDEIISMTSAQHDFLTRMKSLEVIDALGLADVSDELLSNCFEGVFQGNRRWRGSAITFLRKCNEDPNMQKTILAFIETHKSEWQEWQLRRVENVFSIKIEE